MGVVLILTVLIVVFILFSDQFFKGQVLNQNVVTQSKQNIVATPVNSSTQDIVSDQNNSTTTEDFSTTTLSFDIMNWYETKPLSFDNLDWKEIIRYDGVGFIAPIQAPFFNWSPEVKISKGKLNCPVSDTPLNSPVPHFVEKNIGDKPYCLYVYGDGAAGTSYSSSLYITEVEDGLLVEIPIVLSHTNCGSYGDEDIENCKIRQESLNSFMEDNLDGFINKIVSSINIPNDVKNDLPEFTGFLN